MAGPYYVRSADGADGDDGLSWANAKATLGAAVSLAAAGERIYVDDDHQETLAADTTYAFSGTEGNPVEVIVVITDTTTAVTIYNRTNQYIEGGTNNVYIQINGDVYFWGICLETGKGGTFCFPTGKTAVFEKCKIELSGGNTHYYNTGTNSMAMFIDTDVAFDNAGGRFGFYNNTCLLWYGGTLTGDQNNLFQIGYSGGTIRVTGVDLSSISGGVLFVVDETDENSNVEIKGVKLNASPPALITSGISPTKFDSFMMDIADNGNTVYKFRREFQYGYAQDETTKVITGKALYDGTNEFAVKMVSRATPTCSFFDPWRYHLTTLRESGFAASRTYKIHIAQDHASVQPAALENDEIWLEVVYPDDSTAQYNIKTDKIATPTTAPAAQTTSTESWEGLAATTRLQELSVQIDAADGKNGPVEIWVCVAKEDKTVYVCPEVSVS